jgi:hypothetical protein
MVNSEEQQEQREEQGEGEAMGRSPLRSVEKRSLPQPQLPLSSQEEQEQGEGEGGQCQAKRDLTQQPGSPRHTFPLPLQLQLLEGGVLGKQANDI